jgi:glycine cleavage system aminomethyltransferase T
VLAGETGLCHALNFQKGPYLGRTAVNDLHSGGRLKKLLVSVAVDCIELELPCVDLFFANRLSGELVSSAFSPAHHRIAGFAYVEPYLAFTGVELVCQDETRVIVRGRVDTGIDSCDRP